MIMLIMIIPYIWDAWYLILNIDDDDDDDYYILHIYVIFIEVGYVGIMIFMEVGYVGDFDVIESEIDEGRDLWGFITWKF